MCELKYIYIVTEPDFEEYNNYAERFTDYGEDTEDIFNNDKSEYESRILNYYIKLDEDLDINCTEQNCDLCYKSKNDFCISCKNDSFIYNVNNVTFKKCGPVLNTDEIIEFGIDNSTKIESSIINIDTTQMIEFSHINIDNSEKLEIISYTNKVNINEFNSIKCTNDKILKNECKNETIINKQIKEIYTSIKNNSLTEEYNGNNTIIQTKNVIFQLSTIEDQKKNMNLNISSIDLGICEDILKKEYKIPNEDSLIIFKTDIKNSDLSSTYVQYEIYNPNTLEQLDLKYCYDIKISINIPVTLNESIIALYNSLNESGYNLFDSNNDFYKDICSTYTSENGTDITLLDRKNEIFGVLDNLSICQVGCRIESYNASCKKSKCICDIQKYNVTETNINKIDFFSSYLSKSFITTLTNSNFLVLKCYKLALSLSTYLKNKGRITMTIIYLLFIISLIMYITLERKKVFIFISDILKYKTNAFIHPKNAIKNKKQNKIKIKNKNKNKNKKEIKINRKKNKSKSMNIKNKIDKNMKKNGPPKKRNPNKAKTNIDSFNKVNKSSNSNLRINNEINKYNINIIPIKNINYGKNKKKSNKLDKKALSNDFNLKYYQNVNDQELNTL